MSNNVLSALMTQARPRVVAALVRAFRDIDMAEELYQEACVRALQKWPQQGVPDDAIAWLIRVGRNAGIDLVRKRVRIAPVSAEVVLETRTPENDEEADVVREMENAQYKDDVLRLMFMCCHPELSRTDQLALALKVVVGFSVAEIARAFVVSSDAMEQRITRAKKRASAVATQLDTPSLVERTERLRAVNLMVYLLFNEGYSAGAGDEHIRHALCEEAIRLARLLLELFPAQSEVAGLLALCLLQHSRHRARMDADGQIVTLDVQDRTLWDVEMIAEGLVLVEKALRKGRPDALQIQAAIAAVHCAAKLADETDWAEIERLYAALEILQPSPVVTLNRAVAVSKVSGAEAALAMIAPLEDALKRYQPFYSTRAALFEEASDFSAAAKSYEMAMEMTPNAAEKRYLSECLAKVAKKIG